MNLLIVCKYPASFFTVSFVSTTTLPIKIFILIGVSMLVPRLMSVFWLVVIAFIALLVSLPASPLLLFLFTHFLWSLFVESILLLLNCLLQVSWLIGWLRLFRHVFWLFCFASIGRIGSLIFRLIGIGIFCCLSIEFMIVVQTSDVLQIVGIAHQMSLPLFFALRVRRLLFKEERSFIVICDIVVIVFVFTFVVFVVETCVKFGVVIFTSHSFRDQYLQLLKLRLFLHFLFLLLFFLLFVFSNFRYFILFLKAILFFCIWGLGFLLHFFLSRLILIDILIFQLIFKHYDEILEIFSIEVPLFFFSFLGVHILRHLEHIELFLHNFIHYHISHLVFLADAVSLAELFE